MNTNWTAAEFIDPNEITKSFFSQKLLITQEVGFFATSLEKYW